MADADVDVVRSVFEQFDETSELPPELFRTDVEWYPPADDPDNSPRIGFDSAAAYVRGWAQSFDDYYVAVEDLFKRGDSVVAEIVLHGRIAGGSAELRLPLVHLWTVEDGLVTKVREFSTREEALAAIY